MIRPVFSLALIALLCACNKPISKGAEPDAKLVRYLPPDATLLAGVNLQALIASPLYQRHQADLDPRRLDVLSSQIGVDPRKDIQQALITVTNNSPALLLDGHFNNLKPGPQLTFPQRDVLAAGSQPFLAQVAAHQGQIGATLLARLDAVPKADQIWVVSTQGLPLQRVPVAPDIRSALANISDNIRMFSIGMGADQGAHLHAELICDSEAGAKRVHDALRGAIGMGRLMTRDDQLDTLKLYDTVQVDQDHSIVRVHADWDAKEADAAIAIFSHLRSR